MNGTDRNDTINRDVVKLANHTKIAPGQNRRYPYSCACKASGRLLFRKRKPSEEGGKY